MRRLAVFSACLLSAPAWAAPIVWSSGAGGNDHAYEYVAGAATWSAAQAAAAATTFNGQSGYLATITSKAENDFLLATFGISSGPASAWIGASDATVEGEWRWVTGPESGTQFWQGGTSGSTTAPFHYANWGSSEPNDFPSGHPTNEDFAAFALDALSASILAGEWGDANDAGTNASIAGYLVEYDAVPEPAAGALLAFGLALLGGTRRRRAR